MNCHHISFFNCLRPKEIYPARKQENHHQYYNETRYEPTDCEYTFYYFFKKIMHYNLYKILNAKFQFCCYGMVTEWLFFSYQTCPADAYNVPAAWLSGGFHKTSCGVQSFKFALSFPRGYCRPYAKPHVVRSPIYIVVVFYLQNYHLNTNLLLLSAYFCQPLLLVY